MEGRFDHALLDSILKDNLHSESSYAFIQALLSLRFSGHEDSSVTEDLCVELLGEELAEFAYKAAKDGTDKVPLALGKYLLHELNELCRSHIPSYVDGTSSIDIFMVECAISTDDALRKCLGPFIERAEEEVAHLLCSRTWGRDGHDVVLEDTRQNEPLAKDWEEVAATPICDFGVARVYDRESGCYEAPVYRAIWKIALDSEEVIRVALRDEKNGTILKGNLKLTFSDGSIVESVDGAERLEKICHLAWSNQFQKVLQRKKSKSDD